MNKLKTTSKTVKKLPSIASKKNIVKDQYVDDFIEDIAEDKKQFFPTQPEKKSRSVTYNRLK